jgi:hypothetical protein
VVPYTALAAFGAFYLGFTFETKVKGAQQREMHAVILFTDSCNKKLVAIKTVIIYMKLVSYGGIAVLYPRN